MSKIGPSAKIASVDSRHITLKPHTYVPPNEDGITDATEFQPGMVLQASSPDGEPIDGTSRLVEVRGLTLVLESEFAGASAGNVIQLASYQEQPDWVKAEYAFFGADQLSDQSPQQWID